VIARKQKALLIEQRHRSARVPRHRDRHELIVDTHRIAPLDHALGRRRLFLHVGFMNHSVAPELGAVPRVIGDIIAVREEHEPRPPELGDALCERSRRARRVNKDVSCVPLHEVARRSKRRLRRKAAVHHPAFDRLREPLYGVFCRRFTGRPD
jgi:hypothetical protein